MPSANARRSGTDPPKATLDPVFPVGRPLTPALK